MSVAVAALTAFLLLAPTASAKPPNLARHGITVTWPEHQTVPANTPLEVTVRSRRERVALTLMRVTRSGGVMRVLGRKTLRNGTFRVVLPPAVEVTYRLRLEAVGRVWEEDFTSWCGEGTASLNAWVTPAASHPGDVVLLRARNTGSACLGGGEAYGWQRQAADGTWQDVPPPGSAGWNLYAFIWYPGRYYTQRVRVWPTEPGSYRIVKSFGAAAASVPFTILP